MVGDTHLEIPREGYSVRYAPQVVDLVWNTARDLGITQFLPEVGTEIIDDHLPLNEAGIPAIDIIDFDYRVLKPYTAKDLNQLHTIDMLAHIKRRLGHRLSLNALAQATLSADKSADGLQAVTWFRAGKIPELISYCKDDVDLTRRLYEFGRENGYLLYHDRFSGETKKVHVEW